MEHKDLTHQIIGAAYEVHGVLGSGFLEKVYENALAKELQERGITVVQQHPLNVLYKGTIVGEYVMDLVIENKVVVENKGRHPTPARA